MLEEEREIGEKGQIVIPKPFRKAIGIAPGTRVRIELRGNEIVIEKQKMDVVKVFEEIARNGKSIRKFDADKSYDEHMEERWKIIKKST